MDQVVAEIGRIAGGTLGDPARPLLPSVRSGARRVSMPGGGCEMIKPFALASTEGPTNWRLNEEHFQAFLRCTTKSDDAEGHVPRRWAYLVTGATMERLSYKALTHHDLLRLSVAGSGFTDAEVFLSIMAWGGLNTAFGRAIWQHFEAIEEVVWLLRRQDISRDAAYANFSDILSNLKRPGMGPACFTKIVHFCCPSRRAYIMDQWTGRSINLLFEAENGSRRAPVAFNGDQVSPRNSAQDYELFCGLIEYLADRSDEADPAQIARRLATGGPGRRRSAWRQHVTRSLASRRAPSRCAKTLPLKRSGL